MINLALVSEGACEVVHELKRSKLGDQRVLKHDLSLMILILSEPHSKSYVLCIQSSHHDLRFEFRICARLPISGVTTFMFVGFWLKRGSMAGQGRS